MKRSHCGLKGKRALQALGTGPGKKTERVQLLRYKENQVNEFS